MNAIIINSADQNLLSVIFIITNITGYFLVFIAISLKINRSCAIACSITNGIKDIRILTINPIGLPIPFPSIPPIRLIAPKVNKAVK